MICYASYTGNRRNLAALKAHGWRLLVSRSKPRMVEGFARIAADNGAWSDYQAGRPFDEAAFERFLDWLPVTPDWLVLPDIVAGGLRSLDLSVRYLNRCAAVAPLVLLAVQDDIEPADVSSLVGPGVGIFLGGSTGWKRATMAHWGRFCAERGLYYHVGRVNSIKRISQAIAAGATSVDGSSASRYAVNLPKLAYAARQSDLWCGEDV
jgi:hypothetical protein